MGLENNGMDTMEREEKSRKLLNGMIQIHWETAVMLHISNLIYWSNENTQKVILIRKLTLDLNPEETTRKKTIKVDWLIRVI